MLLVGGVGTAVNGATVYVRLLYLSALLIALAWLLTVFSLRGLKVDRQARSLRASVGDIFEEHFEISNTSKLPKLWLEVANETTIPHATGSRVLTFLRAKQKRIYTSRTWLTNRGGFALGPTTITSGDPFGIFRVSKSYPAKSSLVVLPMLFSVAEFIYPPGLLPGGKAIRRKSMDVTPHAAGIREYVPGDPMKRIHWPTSVRRDQLMVKEFEQDPQSEVWLFLDTHKNTHISKPVENDDSASHRRFAFTSSSQGKITSIHAGVFDQYRCLSCTLFYCPASRSWLGQRLRTSFYSHPGRTERATRSQDIGRTCVRAGGEYLHLARSGHCPNGTVAAGQQCDPYHADDLA